MRLKRLEIQGFKSFARPVCLEFGNGITAIVGPNGSGKSNISDAVRWVLGEQSAKSLRGQRMEDIIFAGSDGKRPLGMAEVQLTLDNTDSFLPLDYSEVTVTRRVYRSGDSEFLINKQHCRLRDIHDLFTDTGLGREGYAIIGQGQIEAVLSVRSEERRILLEETAGIVKYRQRKEQALKKLEDTSHDLLRVTDVLHELEKQLEPLSIQAEQARLYLHLAAQLEEEELDYYHLNWDKLEKKWVQKTQEQQQMQLDFEQWNQHCAELTERKADLDSSVQTLEREVEEKQKELFSLIEAYNEGLHSIELYKERLKNYETRSEQLSDVVQEKDVELALIKDETQELMDEFQKLNNKIKSQEQIIVRVKGVVEDKQKKQRQTQSMINQLKDDFFEFMRELADKRNFQRSFADRQQNLQTQLFTNQEESEKIGQHLEQNEKLLSKLTVEKSELEQVLKEQLAEQQSWQQKLIHNKQALIQHQEKTRGLEAQNAQTTARLKTLQEVEEGYEGYAFGVRRIMQNREMSNLVLGTVADVISVPSGLEIAFEVALGSGLQNIITANQEDAKKLIAWLQKVQGGRVTFLPLNSVQGSHLPKRAHSLLNEPGVLGAALDLLKFPEQYTPALASLLGRVVITEDLDTALALKIRLGQFSRIVTRNGSVVFPSGAMTGGSLNNRTSGLLARKAELSELQKKLQGLTEELRKAKNQEQVMEKKILESEKYLEELQKRDVQTQLQAQSNAQSSQQAVTEKLSLQKTLTNLKDKTADLKAVLENLKADSEQAATKVAELEDQEEIQRLHIQEQEQVLVSLIKKMEITAHHQTKEQIYLAELKGSLENLRIKKANLERRTEVSSQVYRDAQTEFEKLQEQKIHYEQTIKEITSRIKIEKETQKDLELSLNEKRQQRQITQKTTSNLGVELAHAQKEQVQRERALYKLEVELQQLEGHREQILVSLTERELTLDNILTREVVHEEMALKKSMENLKSKIKDLGLVNTGATQEYERVQERCEFLQTQLADLNEARDSLQDVINKMDKLCRVRLWETFKQVQTAFQAIFSKLFLGGVANLVLTDPESILTTGIEIMARPPGKKLQNLLLLSGGERALTAIALLFAIRKVKPTPFCVLDEIDAALDESNLHRFTQLMEEFAQDTQFVVITHRPLTMEVAHTLYGVTMGDEAVSQIISVALN